MGQQIGDFSVILKNWIGALVIKAAKAVALQWIDLRKTIVLTAINRGLLVVQPPVVELLFSSFLSPNVDATDSLFKSTIQKEELLPNSFQYLSPSACCSLPFGLQITRSLLVLLKAVCLLWKGHCYASRYPENGGS